MLDQIIENLKQLPEDGFRVWEPGYSGLAWLPYLTVFYPVQIGLMGQKQFSVKPVGDVADILWNRYPDLEAAMNALIEAGGHIRVKRDSSLIAGLDGLRNRGLAVGTGDGIALLTPEGFLKAYPDFNRPANEADRSAPGRAKLNPAEVLSISKISLLGFRAGAYNERIEAGSLRVFISELQEVLHITPPKHQGDRYYGLKLWNFRTNTAETMELDLHSTRELTCYWLEADPPAQPAPVPNGIMSLKDYYDYTGQDLAFIGQYEILQVRPSTHPHMITVYYMLPNGSKGQAEFSENTQVILKPNPEPAPLPPARPVAVGREDLVLAVRRFYTDKAGGVDEVGLYWFVLDVLKDQKPEPSPDPAPLIAALEAIKSGMVGDYTPDQIAQQALYGYKNGAGH